MVKRGATYDCRNGTIGPHEEVLHLVVVVIVVFGFLCLQHFLLCVLERLLQGRGYAGAIYDVTGL